jgi:DNA repair ATPase RecN
MTLTDKQRVAELSRMLSGSESTAARTHAKELLASAQHARAERG